MDWLALVVGVLALGLVGLGAWAVVRLDSGQRLRDKGWDIDSAPGLEVVHGLNNPPFGLGFGRGVDDLVTGTTADGVPFQAFTYRCDAWTGGVLTMPLPASLPPFAAAGGAAPAFPGRPTLLAHLALADVPHPAYTQQVVDAAAPVLTSEAAARYRLGVDHDRVVLADVGPTAGEIEAALGILGDLRARVLASPAGRTPGPRPPDHLAFAGHPDWTLVERDDSLLEVIGHTTGGANHEAHDIVYSENAGLPFVRLRHRWEPGGDGEPGARTTAVERNEEILCEFRATFPFPGIAVNWDEPGPVVRFDAASFDDAVTVHCAEPEFAATVIHARQREFLLAAKGPGFKISGDGRIQVRGEEFQPFEIEYAAWYLRAFFGGVPDVVWKQLGAWPRPIPAVDHDVLMGQLARPSGD